MPSKVFFKMQDPAEPQTKLYLFPLHASSIRNGNVKVPDNTGSKHVTHLQHVHSNELVV